MNGNNAYTVDLTPNSTSPDEAEGVNQSSPTWVLTFVRFENRDTLRNTTISAIQVNNNDPLVVENDCVAVSTTMNKGTLTPGMEATLKETDINYLTAVAPGDFVFVNMLNWEVDASRVANNARNGLPINGPKDGFKGIFKVQGVRRNLVVNEQSGTKSLTYKIDGYGFTEFNNTIYFNQNLLASGSQDNYALFIRRLSHDWANIIGPSGFINIQNIVSTLITSFIGNGINTTDGSDDFKVHLPTANTQFLMPALVGSLLGVNKPITAAKDIYNYLFGIQSYSTSLNQTMAQGLNPQLKSTADGPGFRYTTTELYGDTFFSPEFWNANKAWSIITQYINNPLNEIYTCYKLSEDNRIYPTVVFRQIPFTTQDFESRFGINPSVTKFLTVPRWKLDPALVYSFDIGRDEAARVNFVQYYSRVGLANDKSGAGAAQEVASFNYVFDVNDVTRSGLRPSIISGNFDPFVSANVRSPTWAKIVADSTIGSQLKLNGTLECVGIVSPICIGDNLEIEGIVFHIETVMHNCFIDPITGLKRFKTVLKLSSGISADSTSSVTKYSEMAYTNGYMDRQNDYDNLGKMLPGISESQNIISRTTNPDISNQNQKSNSPFPQPTKPKGSS